MATLTLVLEVKKPQTAGVWRLLYTGIAIVNLACEHAMLQIELYGEVLKVAGEGLAAEIEALHVRHTL